MAASARGRGYGGKGHPSLSPQPIATLRSRLVGDVEDSYVLAALPDLPAEEVREVVDLCGRNRGVKEPPKTNQVGMVSSEVTGKNKTKQDTRA